MQTETGKGHPSSILPEDDAAQMRNPIGRAMNKEAMQMLTTPAECILKDFVEFGDTGCADHEQSPPHQRTHAAEHYAKLIDRNGRYRRFRHANSLSKRKPTVLNLMTPRNLPLSLVTALSVPRTRVSPALESRANVSGEASPEPSRPVGWR